MKISSLQLINFKRFTDLKIENIPSDAKLVLLIGSNGSGKSSVFDAFRFTEHEDPKELMSYYQKNNSTLPKIKINNHNIKNNVYSYEEKNIIKNIGIYSFYGRTSFRHVPRLNVNKLPEGKPFLGNFPTLTISTNPLFIDKDNLFESDIEIISSRILKEVFRSKTTSEEIQKNYIKPINDAFERIFELKESTKLTLIEIIPPLDGYIAQINFKKGASEIHYNLLSAGEKEVVNILFNLLVRREDFKNTVYYIDELDLHLNTKLQFNLIKEITENWIPENCQLWTASHSLGFIDYASDNANAVILDFDDLDFDKPQIISPSDKKDYQVFELAVGKQFIDKIFKDKRIIFSENTDTIIYNDLSFQNTFFFTANDKLDVFTKSNNLKTLGLIDRDYLSDNEVNEIIKTYPNIKILPYYSIENLLYHPDNLVEYYESVGITFHKEQYIGEIIAEKNKQKNILILGLLKARDGYPFYKENENNKRLKEFRGNSKAILEFIESDNFEVFFKVYPMKESDRTIYESWNLNKKELPKTNWFRKQIENTLKN